MDGSQAGVTSLEHSATFPALRYGKALYDGSCLVIMDMSRQVFLYRQPIEQGELRTRRSSLKGLAFFLKSKKELCVGICCARLGYTACYVYKVV